MIGLFTSEWLRFRSRKLVRWLCILATVGIVVVMVLATVASTKPTSEQVASAERRAERVLARCVENRNDSFFLELPDGVSPEEYCRENFAQVDFFLSGDRLQLRELPEYLQAAGFIVMLIGLVIGASFVGASWQSGTITTILTWEPRRLRWFLARMVVLAIGVFAVVLTLLLLLSLALAAGATLRGSTSTDPGWLSEVVGTALRIAGVAVAMSFVGAAVAMIGRNTTAALGAVFVYLAVVESLVRGLRPATARFMLSDNIVSVMANERLDIRLDNQILAVTPARAVVVIAVYVVVLLSIAAVSLRARDVQ